MDNRSTCDCQRVKNFEWRDSLQNDWMLDEPEFDRQSLELKVWHGNDCTEFAGM